MAWVPLVSYDFEDGAQGWTFGTGCGRSTTVGLEGSASIYVTQTTNGGYWATGPALPSALTGGFRVRYLTKPVSATGRNGYFYLRESGTARFGVLFIGGNIVQSSGGDALTTYTAGKVYEVILEGDVAADKISSVSIRNVTDGGAATVYDNGGAGFTFVSSASLTEIAIQAYSPSGSAVSYFDGIEVSTWFAPVTYDSTRTHLPVDMPVVTWKHAVTGQIHALDVTGQPSMTAARGIGYESATIPCELTEAERADIQGAEVLVHSTGWRGRVLSRPEPNEPLLVTGYGRMREWVGPDDGTYIYAKRDWMSSARPDTTVPASANPGAFKLENADVTMRITQSPNTTCDSGNHAGYRYSSDHAFQKLTFDVQIGHADIELRIYSLTGEQSPRLVYSRSGVGTYYNQTAYLSGVEDVAFTGHGLLVYGWIRTTPSTPSRSDKWVKIWNTRLIGGAGLPAQDTSWLVKDILSDSTSTYITLTPEPFDVMEFDAWSPAAKKMSELMKAYPIEYGEYDGLSNYDGMSICTPYVFDRPEGPAYLLRLEDCVSLPKIEHARLDELTSGIIVKYRDENGDQRDLWVQDEDPTHPLVRMGLDRYGIVDVGSTTTDLYTAGAAARDETGRPRIKGEATTGRLLTITGAPADHARVKCGEVVRVEWLGVDARIERIEWRGRYITLTLDNEPYRLDMMLAKLAQRE